MPPYVTAIHEDEFGDELQQSLLLLGRSCVAWSPISAKATNVHDADACAIVSLTMGTRLANCLALSDCAVLKYVVVVGISTVACLKSYALEV